jgi:ribosomal protein S18 acetylase RimI-like enzyme
LGAGALSQTQSKVFAAPVPINPAHDLTGFDCGVPALNVWLHERALRNESRFSRTYVLTESEKVVGYYCLLAGSVERASAPAKMRRNAPNPIPIAVIGRLAVSRTHAGRGLGRDLLADALRRVAFASRAIGVAALLVHAKDERAKAFYMGSAEFVEYPAESRTLYLPIETLIAALQ